MVICRRVSPATQTRQITDVWSILEEKLENVDMIENGSILNRVISQVIFSSTIRISTVEESVVIVLR